MTEHNPTGQARHATAANVPLQNTVWLAVILSLVFIITAMGFRRGSVWWLAASVAQFIVVGAQVGVLSFETPRVSRADIRLFDLEFHGPFCRMVLELYLVLLLVLPFVTVFDDWIAEER